jgi:hypothetical protein
MKYLLILIFLFSCGSRKVNLYTEEIKKDSLVEVINIKKDTIAKISNNNTNIFNSNFTDEFTISPFDTTKSIFINKIEYKNAIIRIKKTKSNSLYVNNKKVSVMASKQSIGQYLVKTSNLKNTKTKKIDRKANYIIYIYFIIIFLIIFLIYKYKKYLFNI